MRVIRDFACIGVTTTACTANPATPELYATIDAINGNHDFLIEIDRQTANSTTIGDYGSRSIGITGIEYDPASGTLYAIDFFDFLYEVDIETAEITNTFGLVGGSWRGLTLDHTSGGLLAIDERLSNDELYRLDPLSGAAELLVELEPSTQIVDLAMNQGSGVLYGAETIRSDSEIVTIDPMSGEVTTIVTLAGRSIRSLTFDPVANVLLSVDENTSELLSIDTASGIVKGIGFTGFERVAGLAVVIPAPGVPLAICASCIVTTIRRRR